MPTRNTSLLIRSPRYLETHNSTSPHGYPFIVERRNIRRRIIVNTGIRTPQRVHSTIDFALIKHWKYIFIILKVFDLHLKHISVMNWLFHSARDDFPYLLFLHIAAVFIWDADNVFLCLFARSSHSSNPVDIEFWLMNNFPIKLPTLVPPPSPAYHEICLPSQN